VELLHDVDGQQDVLPYQELIRTFQSS
jgi:hypothetical protein